jgi:hypothetical protein
LQHLYLHRNFLYLYFSLSLSLSLRLKYAFRQSACTTGATRAYALSF